MALNIEQSSLLFAQGGQVLDYREALDIARRNPGARVTRGADGQFVVLREESFPSPGSDPANDENERLKQANALLQKRYNDVVAQLEDERRVHKADILAHEAKIHQLWIKQHASDAALKAASQTNDQLRTRIAKVSLAEWARIEAHEEEERNAHAKRLRAETHVQKCRCQGEVENCVRCYGRGSYTVDGFGNPV